MSDAPLPPPESCRNNLRRLAADGRSDEPTDLCRNDVGVFHMLDCPLFIGLSCSYYAPAEPDSSETPSQPALDAGTGTVSGTVTGTVAGTATDEAGDSEPAGVTSDEELDEVSWQLRREFLSWGYTRRVRALRRPVGALDDRIVVESIDEPEEQSEITLRVAPAAGEPAAEGVASDAAAAVGAADGVADEAGVEDGAEDLPPVVEAGAPSRPEQYPGQRRSEDKSAGKKPRRRPSVPDEATADSAGTESVDAPPVEPPPRKKTIDELLESLPEAPLPEGGERRRRRSRSRGRSGASGTSGEPRKDGAAPRAAGAGKDGGQRAAGKRGRRGRGGGGGRPRTTDGSAGTPKPEGQPKPPGTRPRRRRRRGGGGRAGGSGSAGDGGGSGDGSAS